MPIMLNMSKYRVYTYQFVPLQHFQASLFGEENLQTSEQAMMHKQEIFSNLLEKDDLTFSFKNKIYGHKILLNSMGITVFRIANNKIATFEKEFQKRRIEYTPSCIVIIDNRENMQYIAIEEDVIAFYDTEQVSKILQSQLNNQYKDKVELVRFHFSYPNLPRVNKTIKEIIASASKSTNSKQSSFELKSASGESLFLDQSNQELNDLANYAADSGDEIEIKTKGIRSFLKTGSTSVSIEINDLEATISKDIFQNGIEKLIEQLNRITKS